MKKTLIYKDKNTVFEAHVSTERGYLSVTGDLYERHPQRGEPTRTTTTGKTVWLNSCGCLHEEVRKHFPKLTPFLNYHLAGVDGAPMHYVENAVYWAVRLAGVSAWAPGSYDPDPEKAFKQTVVFNPLLDSMPDLLLPVNLREHADPAKAAHKHVRKVVTEWCEARRPRLQKEVTFLLSELAREDFEAVYSAP